MVIGYQILGLFCGKKGYPIQCGFIILVLHSSVNQCVIIGRNAMTVRAFMRYLFSRQVVFPIIIIQYHRVFDLVLNFWQTWVKHLGACACMCSRHCFELLVIACFDGFINQNTHL